MGRRRWLCSVVTGLCLASAMVSATFAAQTAPEAPMSTATHSRPRVLILATGGTIAGKADARSAIGYDAGGVSGQDLIAGVPGLDKLATLHVEQIANIGSQNMNDGVWFALAKRIKAAFAAHEADAVVVTHGTDTMEETAFFLQTVLKSPYPVVVTGAMRPSTAISADGPANLYEAVKVAVAPQAKGRGVMVVLNDTIHAARWVTKVSTTDVQTFHSINAGPIGYVDPASVRFLAPAVQAKAAVPDLSHAEGKLPRVEIIYGHSNMDARQIDHAIEDGARGIVLAGIGDGNASDEALAGLDRAVAKGLLVVRASRVGSGLVNRNVEVSDDTHGYVVSYDLNPQKARILLQVLIAGGVTDVHAVQAAFGQGLY
ncbi:asparaginase [Acetobacter cibinongensis]|uniref:L-asparaginase II n=1 Tax=Acetobacter cibinongensis TaxID=146475 RepID=A0A1Z5YYY5_9PROT|nr:L-asparaginase II [Acetobacter cibinongensis]